MCLRQSIAIAINFEKVHGIRKFALPWNFMCMKAHTQLYSQQQNCVSCTPFSSKAGFKCAKMADAIPNEQITEESPSKRTRKRKVGKFVFKFQSQHEPEGAQSKTQISEKINTEKAPQSEPNSRLIAKAKITQTNPAGSPESKPHSSSIANAKKSADNTSLAKYRKKPKRKKFVFKFSSPDETTRDTSAKTVVPREILEAVKKNVQLETIDKFSQNDQGKGHIGDSVEETQTLDLGQSLCALKDKVISKPVQIETEKLSEDEVKTQSLAFEEQTQTDLPQTPCSVTDSNDCVSQAHSEESVQADALLEDVIDTDLLRELPFAEEPLLGASKELDGSCTSKKKGKKKKKKFAKNKKEDEDKKPKMFPNYFISLPITNPKIQTDIESVQKCVVNQVPELEAACIKTPKLHLTLMVMNLQEEQVNSGQLALRELRDEINFDPPMVLTFHGVSHFRQAVLYADLQEDEHSASLATLVEKVRTKFAEKGISATDDKFTPHVTILKLSKLRRKKGKVDIKKIPMPSFEDYLDHSFGEQIVESLSLCAMLKAKAADGGYFIEEQINLVPDDLKHKPLKDSDMSVNITNTQEEGSMKEENKPVMEEANQHSVVGAGGDKIDNETEHVQGVQSVDSEGFQLGKSLSNKSDVVSGDGDSKTLEVLRCMPAAKDEEKNMAEGGEANNRLDSAGMDNFAVKNVDKDSEDIIS